MPVPHRGLPLRLCASLHLRLRHLLHDVGLHALQELQDVEGAVDPLGPPGQLIALPRIEGGRDVDDDAFQLILPARRARRQVFVSRYLMIVFWYCVANTASGLLMVQAGAPTAVSTWNGPIFT